MRALIKLVVVMALLAFGLLGVAAYFTLATAPAVTDDIALSHADIARAERIVKRNDPRNLPPGAYRSITIAEHDLELAANYLLQRSLHGKARMSAGAGYIDGLLTLRVPHLPMRPYFNLSTRLVAEGGKPRIESLTVGRIPIPQGVSNALLQLALDALAARIDDRARGDLIQNLSLAPGQVQFTYRWNPELIDAARTTLLSGNDRDALRFYHDTLVDLQSRGIGRRGALVDLLREMFEAAQQRSRAHDAVVENTALLTVLGTWSSRQNLAHLVPGDIARPEPFRVKLRRRTDFAQHFLTSAALAARGDGALSDAVGLFKEINDTEHGSGFSFTDIAADRAGTRFAELATESPASAARLQRRLAAGIDDGDIMPDVADLPEHLRGAAFKAQFGHVGSPAYHAVMQEIERRIAATPLHQN